MSKGSAVSSGLAETMRAVEQLPKAVTAQLRSVAFRASREVKERARQNLLRSHPGAKTADTIVIDEHADERRYQITVQGDPARPPNLPLWLERGTRYMAATPYMRPAEDAVRGDYVRESAAAAADVVREALE